MAYEKLFAALADPTRRALFEALGEGERSVGELSEGLPVSRPAVSQHLRVLSDAGLVVARRDGTRRLYRANGRGLLELQLYLHRTWGAVLRAFKEKADELHERDTEDRRSDDR